MMFCWRFFDRLELEGKEQLSLWNRGRKKLHHYQVYQLSTLTSTKLNQLEKEKDLLYYYEYGSITHHNFVPKEKVHKHNQ